MGMVYLNDTTTEMILCTRDLQNLISDKLGKDAEIEFNNIINDKDEKIKICNDEIRSFEMSLDSNRDCFLDILDSLDRINRIVSSPRVNKKDVLETIKLIRKNINNQI